MKMGKIGKYIICIVVIAGLIFSAFWVPEWTLSILDGQMRQNYTLESREEFSFDYESISAGYEMDLGSRLGTFAEGCRQGNQYYAIPAEQVDAEKPKEIDVLRLLFDGEFYEEENISSYWPYCLLFAFLEEENAELSTFDLERAESYVLYDGDTLGSGPLLCRYYVITRKSGYSPVSLKLLTDTRDDTLYYAEICSNRTEYFYNDMSDSSVLDFLQYNYYMISDYYGVAQEDVLSLLETLEMFGISVKDYDQYNPDTGKVISFTTGFRMEDGRCLADLNYGGGSLNFEFFFEQDGGLQDGNPLHGICFGIREIERLLPREIKNDSAE